MFRIIDEGDVFATRKNCLTCASRTAVLADGSLVCTFTVNSNGGANDFVTMITYSKDGKTWTEAQPVWPAYIGKKSIFVSIRPTGDGRYILAGVWWDIAYPGEHFWDDENGTMKENELVYAISDDGIHFGEPQGVPLPYEGAAEDPGGAMVDADGTITFIYSPYRATGHKETADTCCMVMMKSTDGGRTFVSSKFAAAEAPCEYGEAWLVRLSSGRLFVSTWQTASKEAPDQYLISNDGISFIGPKPHPFRGQSTAACPGSDDTVYIVYNQRKESPVGVWIALEKVGEEEITLLENQVAWKAVTTTRSGSSGDFTEWTDFSFGEPHVTVLADGSLYVVLWYQQEGISGVRYVRLRRAD